MAPSATSSQSQSSSSKIKRPIPPGIQTNGINSRTSSPSPSMSAGRLPSTAKYPPNSATSNGAGSSTSGPRSASRNRRDPPAQLLGRGQRNSSVGLRSANAIGEPAALPSAGAIPYVKTDEYILKKYRGNVPSLIIHLHPTHFRFDQQEGSFTYKSPMRIVIEHIRQRTIPHDLIEFLDVPFYEGCMIVQIHDHKSSAPSQDVNKSNVGPGKATPSSIHNYNTFLTPSPYTPYPTSSPPPTQSNEPANEDVEDMDVKSSSQKDKENMPAPAVPGDNQRIKQGTQPKKPKISTIVLHPTPLSSHISFLANAADTAAHGEGTKDSRVDGGTGTVPPTPSIAIPSTPLTGMAPPPKRQKKGKAEIDISTIYGAESQISVHTTSELMLEPVQSARALSVLLKALAHPMHQEKPPSPKSRKRTVAEMAADEALAADQERFMLTMDERLSWSNTGVPGANPVDSDGRVGGASFEPRFERFKTIENLKTTHEEKARIERLRKEEADRKSSLDRERDRLRIEAEKREQEKVRSTLQAQQLQQAQLQQANARQLQQQDAHRRAALSAGQQQQTTQGPQSQIQAQHAHPQANGMMPNGVQGPQQRFQQQVSQAPVSSPIVRNGTPQNHSSPMNGIVGNVPMQQSTSSMGGSPARPGSVVHQNHQSMNAPTPHGMVSQRSQQSHAGTPRMPNSTPNVQNTPLNRPMGQTPRMSQGSPLQGQVAPNIPPQMQMLPNGQTVQLTPQQQQAHLARMHAMQQSRAMGMPDGQPQMTPQQMMQFHALQAQRVQAHTMQQQGMQMGGANFAAQMAALQNQNRTTNGVPQNMGQNFVNPNPNIQMNMQIPGNMQQQQLLIRQQQMQQAQRNQQHAPQQQNQAQMDPRHAFNQQVMRVANMIYAKELPALQARYPNGMVPEDQMAQFRRQTQALATQQLQANLQARRMQQTQQQQQHQQQMMSQGQMPQNMHGMQNGMGM